MPSSDRPGIILDAHYIDNLRYDCQTLIERHDHDDSSGAMPLPEEVIAVIDRLRDLESRYRNAIDALTGLMKRNSAVTRGFAADVLKAAKEVGDG